jgi:hypothetical protein
VAPVIWVASTGGIRLRRELEDQSMASSGPVMKQSRDIVACHNILLGYLLSLVSVR